MRQADALEIEPEIDARMIDAAVRVLSNWDSRFGDLRDLATDILEASMTAKAIRGK